MKKWFLVLLCLFIVSAVSFADMSKEELQQMYLSYLRSQSISATVDSDGDIEFRFEGVHFNALTFWIIVNEEDQQFFQIVILNCYSLDTENEKLLAPVAAAIATRRADVVKIYLNSSGTNVHASAEAYVAKPADFRAIFHKLMRELDEVMYIFLNEMR